MTNLTILEAAVLNAIINSEYQDGTGSEVIGNPVWYINHSDVKNDMTAQQLPGVVSSLVKKGYVNTCIEKNHNDSTICITKLGWEAYQGSK